MRRKGPVHILAVLVLDIDVLIQGTSQCSVHHLDAAADTQYRNLSVGCQSGQQQFLPVAVGIDVMKFLDGLFVQEQRIDIGSACQQDSVYFVQQVDQCLCIIERGDDKRNGTCLQDRCIVTRGKHQVAVAEVSGDTDDRLFVPVRETAVQFPVIGFYIECLRCFHTLIFLRNGANIGI